MLPLLLNSAQLKGRGKSDKSRSSCPRAGFSLVELLAVIAIIAILSAVIFPVAGTVRIRSQEGQVIANLHAIHGSLGMYKLDEHNYPPTLGSVLLGTGANATGYNGLYPEWLRDRAAYDSPANDVQDPSALVPVNQNGSVTGGYVADTRGKNNFNDPAMQNKDAQMYAWDTADGSILNGSYILHYSLYRTFDTADPDYKRQLWVRNPPDDTVITWNDTFVKRDESSGAPIGGEYLVLFMNGQVKKFSADKVMRATGNKEGLIWKLRPYS